MCVYVCVCFYLVTVTPFRPQICLFMGGVVLWFSSVFKKGLKVEWVEWGRGSEITWEIGRI